MNSINCKGKLLNLDEPVVMGIINATPDSFYEGHLKFDKAGILLLAGKMISDGAAILDIGGQSTKPGSENISVQEEMDRVLPVIEQIHTTYPDIILSVDTYNSAVASVAVLAGVCIVNDISGGKLDGGMLATVAGLQVPYVCMHMQGIPSTMQKHPVYKNVVEEVTEEKVNPADKAWLIVKYINNQSGQNVKV